MSIRAFFEKWTAESLNLFPNGSLFPIAVESPDAKDVVPNEDGTITLTVTFGYTDEEVRKRFLAVVDEYLKEVKGRTGAIITVTIDKV